MEKLVGFYTLKLCVGQFFKEFYFKSATLGQYLDVINRCTEGTTEKYFSEPMGDVLRSWLDQGEMPVVKVSLDEERNVLLQQTPHCPAVESTLCVTESNALWKIPVLFTDFHGQLLDWKLLSTSRATFPASTIGENFLLNYNLSFPYSVQYSEELLQRILGALTSESLDTLQAQLIVGDLFENTADGYGDISSLLRVSQMYLEHVTQYEEFLSYYVIESLCSLFAKLVATTSAEHQKRFQKFFAEVSTRTAAREYCSGNLL